MGNDYQSLAGKELPDGIYDNPADGTPVLVRRDQNSAPNYLKTEEHVMSRAKEVDASRKAVDSFVKEGSSDRDNFTTKLNYLVRKMNQAYSNLAHSIQCSEPSMWEEKMWRKVGDIYFGFYRCSDGGWMAYIDTKRNYSDWGEGVYGIYPPKPLGETK